MHVAGTPLLYNAIEWLQGQEDLQCSSTNGNGGGGSDGRGGPTQSPSNSHSVIMPSSSDRADGLTAHPGDRNQQEEQVLSEEEEGEGAELEPQTKHRCVEQPGTKAV
ncbi:MAG: hypothetical protein WDW38_010167 [Sanguina aurantia]